MQVPVESNMLHIDRESCRGDALCVNICPVSCLRMRDGKAAPVPLADRICLGCGQCMAVCPEHAISSGESGEEQISPLPAIPDFAACSALIRSRRSVRHYKKTPIPREILSAALDTACYAPTGKNRQDVKWIILDNASRVRELSAMVINAMRSMPYMARLVAAFDKGEDPVLRNAPCAIFAHAASAYALCRTDCALAVGYLDLVLHSQGIGSCWAGFVLGVASSSPEIRKFFKLDDNRVIHAGIMCGYPAVHYRSVPPRKKPDILWL